MSYILALNSALPWKRTALEVCIRGHHPNPGDRSQFVRWPENEAFRGRVARSCTDAGNPWAWETWIGGRLWMTGSRAKLEEAQAAVEQYARKHIERMRGRA